MTDSMASTEQKASTQKTDSMAMTQKSIRTLVFGADHGGFELKNILVAYAKELGYRVLDAGTFTPDAVDHPAIAERALRLMLSGRAYKAVLVCGTGVGISIAANKIPGVRCALCSDATCARLTREHNDANALAMGGRIVGSELAKDILRAFLSAEFQGGRHARRVEKIMALERFDPNKPIEGEYREC